MKIYFSRFTLGLILSYPFYFGFCPRRPAKEANKREADLVELTKLEQNDKARYPIATANNFVGRPVYTEACGIPAAACCRSLIRVQKQLKKKGLGL